MGYIEVDGPLFSFFFFYLGFYGKIISCIYNTFIFLEMKINNKIFFLGIILATFPLVLGAGLISGKERMIIGILSLFLLIFYFFKKEKLLHYVLFLSLFFSVFLISRFIFFEKIDLFFFQVMILILILFRKRDWSFDNFSIGMICVVVVTFLLQFFINRAFLGFYLNLGIDLKRHWPIFLFPMTYFIINNNIPERKINSCAAYFAGLFIVTIFLSYFNPIFKNSIVAKKAEYNLAFFYKDKENWRDMSSSFRRGLVYEYLGLWSKARNEFKKILIASPEDIDAHFNLAQSYAAEKLWYEAMVGYEKVVKLNPYYCGSHYGLAMAYEALGETEMAEEEFLKEIEINPEEIKAYLALEKIYNRQELVKKADKIKSRRLRTITASIDEKNIGDENLRILPIVLNGGAVTVEIKARGTPADGFWPRMEVWLSRAGRLVRGGDAWVRSNSWESYYFHFNTLPGKEKIIIQFMNDRFRGHDNDRNLYIKQINFIYAQR